MLRRWWPFVTAADRAASENAQRALEEFRATCLTELRAVSKTLAWFEPRYDDLLAKYHTLKLQGFSTPVEPPKVEQRASDPVTDAIHRKAAGKGPAVRAAMMAEAERLKAAGATTAEIVGAVNRGHRVQDEFADA